MSSPPWSGDDVVGLVSWAPVTAADLDRLVAARDRDAERRRRPRRRRGGDAAGRVGLPCARLLRRRDGRPRARAPARAGARGRRARSERARRCMERTCRGRAPARLRCPARRHRLRANRSCAREARACARHGRRRTRSVRVRLRDRRRGSPPLGLDELLRTSTAISVHVPLTEETRGLIGARELALLPDGAFVVNVSRGGLVDIPALLEALESGRLGGVALDVLEVEPPTPASPAPSAPGLIVNPHAGWYSEHADELANRRAAESVLDVLEGGARAAL